MGNSPRVLPSGKPGAVQCPPLGAVFYDPVFDNLMYAREIWKEVGTLGTDSVEQSDMRIILLAPQFVE